MAATRRSLFRLIGGVILAGSGMGGTAARTAVAATPTLGSVPLSLVGHWEGSPVESAQAVIARMREVCLQGVRLLSDRQPQSLRVDAHTGGNPQVQIHEGAPTQAWIIVDIGPSDWCKLAYQFGHELGHVLCNSWVERTRLAPPSHWLEEVMVEAFSIRGLGLLADSWDQNPVLPANPHFGRFVREYREKVLARYREAAAGDAAGGIASWLRAKRDFLDHADGLDKAEGPGVLAVLTELERDRSSIEDLGAVNRWPAKSGVPLEEYLRLWLASCTEIHAPGHLPTRLQKIFALP